MHLPERVGIHLAAHRNDMRSAALGVRIEESNDPSELVPDHLLPVQFTEQANDVAVDGEAVRVATPA